MSSVKSKNTRPEIIVRKYLYNKGYRFRVNVKKIHGTPDIVLRKYSSVIFVNGCFWHGHSCKSGKNIPKSNVEYWRIKIEHNIIRDIENYKILKEEGWNVFVVWECQLKVRNQGATLSVLSNALDIILLNKFRLKDVII